MLKKINPTRTKSWQKLAAHFEDMKSINRKSLFANDPKRFNKFSLRYNDILVDFSKNRITEKTTQLYSSWPMKPVSERPSRTCSRAAKSTGLKTGLSCTLP